MLDAAIERGALIPFFQAKVCMRTCQISGAEALARIAITHDQYANPVPYIQLAEQTDRIDDLTLTLTRTVAHHVSDYRVNGEPMPVSINISPLSLTRRDFPDQLAQIVEAAGLSCTQVTLEVTETRLMESGPDVLETMARMRIKGFGLSVDDFGTGASNIDRLQHVPVHRAEDRPDLHAQRLHRLLRARRRRDQRAPRQGTAAQDRRRRHRDAGDVALSSPTSASTKGRAI